MIRNLCTLATAALIIATSPVQAKKNDPALRLEFMPQQTIGGVEVHLPGPMLHIPARLYLGDGRAGDAPRSIGTRTDDDDQMTTLFATNEVVPYVADVMRSTLPQWGMLVEDTADLLLDATLVRFRVSETNNPVGAMYRAEVRLGADLKGPGGKVLWSGTASGDATRYGRKFSSDNANEVLSDAMLNAFAAMLRSPQLQFSWARTDGTATEVSASNSAPAAGPVSPSELLREVLRLMNQGFESKTIESYVSRQKLTTTLTADDLAEWKSQDVPERVIQLAVDLPVR